MVSSPEIGAIVPQRLLSLHPQKIAVVRRNGIGDLLMSLPLMIWCKRQFAGELLLVCDFRNRECAEWIQTPPWSELLLIKKGNKYFEACRMAWELRRHKLDLIVSAKPTPMRMMNVLLGLSGAKLKRAVVDATSVFGFGVNWPVDPSEIEAYPHQALRILHLLSKDSALELEGSYYPKMRQVGGAWKEQWLRLLDKSGFDLSASQKTLYINVTNNRASSRLALEQVVATLDALGWKPQLILGGLPGEREIARHWFDMLTLKGYRVVLALSHELPLTLAALQGSSGVLTGDGGLMHLAAACDTPQLALFGQTSVEKWKPFSKRARTLFHPQAVSQLSPTRLAEELEKIWIPSL